MQRALVSVLLGLSLAACQPGYRASSPEVLYSKNADTALELQVPPDLNNVAEGEQFVLPGTSGGAITRNTLLPETAVVRFVRQGSENYLDISASPEALWPQLQAFLRSERYPIASSEPVSGSMTSQWRELTDEEGRSALKSLLRSDESVSRVAFRLERGSGNTTRLFARQQVADNSDASVGPDDVWPSTSHDPESTSELLVRLMVFLGVQEQRARGILNDAEVAAVLGDATLQSTATDTFLVVYRSYEPAYRKVSVALEALASGSVSGDSNVGRLDVTINGSPVSFRVTPVNVSAARVTVNAAEPLTREQQQALLDRLLEQLV